MEKCELPHCLQSPSDWRILFWKSEGLQTGLGKHIAFALAFYFCPAWLQLHLPAPPRKHPPSQGPIPSLPHTASRSPFVFNSWEAFFQTPFVSSISLKHWKATSKKPGSGSPPPVLAAACPVLCQALPLCRSPQTAPARAGQEPQPPLPLPSFTQTSRTIQWLNSLHSNCFIAPTSIHKMPEFPEF